MTSTRSIRARLRRGLKPRYTTNQHVIAFLRDVGRCAAAASKARPRWLPTELWLATSLTPNRFQIGVAAFSTAPHEFSARYAHMTGFRLYLTASHAQRTSALRAAVKALIAEGVRLASNRAFMDELANLPDATNLGPMVRQFVVSHRWSVQFLHAANAEAPLRAEVDGARLAVETQVVAKKHGRRTAERRTK